MLTETDRKLIENVARVWVDGGGDSHDFDWCVNHIYRAIQAIEEAGK